MSSLQNVFYEMSWYEKLYSIKKIVVPKDFKTLYPSRNLTPPPLKLTKPPFPSIGPCYLVLKVIAIIPGISLSSLNQYKLLNQKLEKTSKKS